MNGVQVIRPAKAGEKSAFFKKGLALAKKIMPKSLVLSGDRLLLYKHSALFFRMKQEQERKDAESGKKLVESEAQKREAQIIYGLSKEFCSLILHSYGPKETIGTCDFFEKDITVIFSFAKKEGWVEPKQRIAVTEALIKKAAAEITKIVVGYKPKSGAILIGAAAIAAGLVIGAIGLAVRAPIVGIPGVFIALAGTFTAGSEMTEFARELLWGLVCTVRESMIKK